MSGKKQPYLDNNWQAFKDAPEEMFESIEFDEFMDWKGCSWELPSTVKCIIRTQHKTTGKVKEFTYRQAAAAEKKIQALLDKPELEFTVVDQASMHFIIPELLLNEEIDEIGTDFPFDEGD